MNVKAWLEQTGLKAHETAQIKPEKLDYLIFYDRVTMRGADLVNNLVDHDLVVEHYAERQDAKSKATLENLFNEKQFSFQKSETFLSGNAIFCTIYSVNFLEKMEG